MAGEVSTEKWADVVEQEEAEGGIVSPLRSASSYKEKDLPPASGPTYREQPPYGSDKDDMRDPRRRQNYGHIPAEHRSDADSWRRPPHETGYHAQNMGRDGHPLPPNPSPPYYGSSSGARGSTPHDVHAPHLQYMALPSHGQFDQRHRRDEFDQRRLNPAEARLSNGSADGNAMPDRGQVKLLTRDKSKLETPPPGPVPPPPLGSAPVPPAGPPSLSSDPHPPRPNSGGHPDKVVVSEEVLNAVAGRLNDECYKLTSYYYNQMYGILNTWLDNLSDRLAQSVSTAVMQQLSAQMPGLASQIGGQLHMHLGPAVQQAVMSWQGGMQPGMMPPPPGVQVPMVNFPPPPPPMSNLGPSLIPGQPLLGSQPGLPLPVPPPPMSVHPPSHPHNHPPSHPHSQPHQSHPQHLVELKAAPLPPGSPSTSGVRPPGQLQFMGPRMTLDDAESDDSCDAKFGGATRRVAGGGGGSSSGAAQRERRIRAGQQLYRPPASRPNTSPPGEKDADESEEEEAGPPPGYDERRQLQQQRPRTGGSGS